MADIPLRSGPKGEGEAGVVSQISCSSAPRDREVDAGASAGDHPAGYDAGGGPRDHPPPPCGQPYRRPRRPGGDALSAAVLAISPQLSRDIVIMRKPSEYRVTNFLWPR